jgi:hypothetical protein
VGSVFVSECPVCVHVSAVCGGGIMFVDDVSLCSLILESGAWIIQC